MVNVWFGVAVGMKILIVHIFFDNVDMASEIGAIDAS